MAQLRSEHPEDEVAFPVPSAASAAVQAARDGNVKPDVTGLREVFRDWVIGLLAPKSLHPISSGFLETSKPRAGPTFLLGLQEMGLQVFLRLMT